MVLTQIPTSDWQPFCDEFSRLHHGWLVNVSIIDTCTLEANSAIQQGCDLATNLVFQGLTDEHVDGEAVLSIYVGDRSKHLTHRIADPSRIFAEEVRDEAHRGLRIDTEFGETILVRFRVVTRPNSISDLAESEYWG